MMWAVIREAGNKAMISKAVRASRASRAGKAGRAASAASPASLSAQPLVWLVSS